MKHFGIKISIFLVILCLVVSKYSTDEPQSDDQGEETNISFSRCCIVYSTGIVGAATATTGAATFFGVPAVLGVIGFSSSGPVMGSLASIWQSTMGVVTAGSWFSTLQALGMVGVSSIWVGTASASATVVSSSILFTNLHKFCTLLEELDYCEKI